MDNSNEKFNKHIASFYATEINNNYQIEPNIFLDDKKFDEKMRKLFIEFPDVLRKAEYEHSKGALSGYLYELLKERILDINSKFRKWRKETINENSIKINVSNLVIILTLFIG